MNGTKLTGKIRYIDKELEALEEIRDFKYEDLQRLGLDNSEPSEALECLERIDNTLCLNNIKGKLEFGIDTEEHTDCDSIIGMTDDLDTIKQALTTKSKKEQAFDYLIKHFNIELQENIELNGNVWARFVHIQAKEDEGEWDCTATANLVDYKKEFDLLKEIIE